MRIVFSAAIVVAGLLLTCGAAHAAGDTYSSLSEARKSAAGPAYDALAAKSTALLEARDAAGLAAHLAALKSDTALDAITREKLLHGTALGMADIEPDSTSRSAIRSLSDYQSVVRVASEDHGHREYYLLYDVAAAARFTEHRWAQNSARKAALTAIAGTDPGLVDRYATGDADVRRGIELAVAASPQEKLVNYSGPLMSGLERGRPVARLAAVTATRTGDATLMLAVLEEAPPQVAVHTLTRMQPEQWPGQALPMLTAAAARPETASAAMFRIADLIGSEPRAREVLLAALGGAHGASAAAALARIGANDLIDELAQRLVTADSDLTRRQALLGLRLADTQRARSHLAAFAARPDAPAHLIEEVPAWLRD